MSIKSIFAGPFPLAAAIALVGLISLSCTSEINFTPPPGSTDLAITHYSFSKIVVGGKTFVDCDVAITPDGNADVWLPKTAHVIDAVDIKAIAGQNIKVLILGLGSDKQCVVTDKALEFISKTGITLYALDTFEAVKRFNQLPKAGLAAFIHTAC